MNFIKGCLLLITCLFTSHLISAQCDMVIDQEVFCDLDSACQGNDLIITLIVQEGGAAPYEVFLGETSIASSPTQYIDIFGVEIPSPYTLIVVDAENCSQEITGSHNCVQYTEQCTDSALNGDEERMDCGGADCAECLQLTYGVECDGLTGEVIFKVYFPDYAIYPFCVTGDTADDDFNDDIISIIVTDNYAPNYRIYDNSGKLGVIADPSIQCTKLSELQDCPEDSNFAAAYTIIPNDENNTFKIDLDLSSGIAPFQIADEGNSTDDEIRYFDMLTNDAHQVLGPFPNSQILSLATIDGNGCESNMTISILDTTTNVSNINRQLFMANHVLAYPSAFHDQTNIKFELASAQEVSISVFHVSGALASTVLSSKRLGEGLHEYTFEGAGLASGIYFFALEVAGQVHTTKILKL